MEFTAYDPAVNTKASLASSLFAPAGGAHVVDGSVVVHSSSSNVNPSSISYYDGSLALGMGAGLLLTSGDSTPNATNSQSGATTHLQGQEPDADLTATVTHVFDDATIYDLTYLQFQIEVTDASLTGLTFSVLFGSEEYPEFADNFVDVAGVYINGVNYALFGGSAEHPLSVLQSNIGAGYFIDNDDFDEELHAGNAHLPIEYDGVSVKLQITAPVHLGVNTIKIAIADTNDGALDSGIFVSGMQAVNYDGFGLSQQVPVTTSEQVIDTAGSQTYYGNALKNLIKLIAGQDVVDAGGGIDQVDVSYLLSSYSWNGATLGLTGVNGNSSQLVNVERVELSAYPNLLVGLDTSAGGNAFGVMALFQAALNTTLATHIGGPESDLMLAIDPVSYWIAQADDITTAGGDLGDVAQQILNTYVSGVSNQTLISLMYENIAEAPADPAIVLALSNMVGAGNTFATLGDLFAFGAMLPENTSELEAAGFTGSILVLNPEPFL